MDYNYLIDSNVWISLFDESESSHLRAVKLLDILEKITIIPDFILQETATVLKLKKHQKMAMDFLDFATKNKEVKTVSFMEEYQDKFSEEFVKLENKKLSYIDSSLLALHKTKKFKVITFDENLIKLIKK